MGGAPWRTPRLGQSPAHAMMCHRKNNAGGNPMIDRRTFASLLAGSIASPSLSLKMSWGQTGMNRAAFYSGVGNTLTRYAVDIENTVLTRHETVGLPANIQYAWQHPSKQFLYVVSSGG